jgi:hypothetical protein
VHGGALAAVLDAAAARLLPAAGPRRVECRLTGPVPVETPLAFRGERRDGACALTILREDQALTAGTVRSVDAAEAAPVEPWAASDGGAALPMSDECLACGAQNPLGLQAALRFDGDGVWARLAPRAPWIGSDGRLEPALAPVLLDEVAWWLGALSMQEGGLTNRIGVTLLAHARADAGAVVAGGRFADVAPVDRRRTFWRTAPALWSADGTLLATASIVFRGGADYSARQMAYFRARTSTPVFRQMFPRYAG